MINIQIFTKNSTGDKFANTSYSQCGEDLIIKHVFAGLGIIRPSYIDIGAYHPFHLNNTALFYANGARGINIEPNLGKFKLFVNARRKDINLNVGVARKPAILDYYEIANPALNTFSKEEAENSVKEGYKIIRISKVKVETLENILQKYWKRQFPHLLSLDAEGMEFEILKEINFRKNYPYVICVETLSFSTSGKGVKDYQLIKYIEKQGYLSYADTNINTIFVKKDRWTDR